MKKIIALIMASVLALMSVMAYDSQYMPSDELAVPDTGVTNVDYCVWQTSAHQFPVSDLSVSIYEVCKDIDGIYGCGPADAAYPADFVVSLGAAKTGVDGCVDVTVTTTDAAGNYYFTINGDTGVSVVTSETAHAYVPEMGVIGALAVLGFAGVYIAKKRKN